MLINEEIAPAANETRPQETNKNIITSSLVGQFFSMVAAVQRENIATFASYHNGKFNLTIILRGHMYDPFQDEEANVRNLLKAIEFLRRVEAKIWSAQYSD